MIKLKTYNDRNGFTLLEFLIASALGIIVLSNLLRFYMTSYRKHMMFNNISNFQYRTQLTYLILKKSIQNTKNCREETKKQSIKRYEPWRAKRG